jgi:4a-hydroxytetrahydrobiopterin dehydratase
MEELTEQKCVACRVGAPSVTAEEIKEFKPMVAEWQIVTEDNIPKLDRLLGRASSADNHRVGQGGGDLVDA